LGYHHKSIPLIPQICQMLANRPMAELVEVLGIGGGEENTVQMVKS